MNSNLTIKEKESIKWYEENGFTLLLDSTDGVNEGIESITSEIKELIAQHVGKNPKQMTEDQKKEWFKTALKDMQKTNLMLAGIVQELRKLHLGDEK